MCDKSDEIYKAEEFIPKYMLQDEMTVYLYSLMILMRISMAISLQNIVHFIMIGKYTN